MKLPLLLTQFLYETKKLSLPGIGDFTLDPSAVLPDEPNKEGRSATLGIGFTRNLSTKPDDKLIEFIRAHTGKIKPLAVADLESYLTLGTELLNIGKPFYLEGIGTLTKDREGRFEFSPGEYATLRSEDSHADKAERLAKRKMHAEDARTEPGEERHGNRSMPWLVGLAIIAGLCLVGWGGYVMYKKNAARESERNAQLIQTDSAQRTDSSQGLISSARDSVALGLRKAKTPRLMGDSVRYKYVILQTHDKARALKRYNQLLSYDLKINLYTQDSSFFKVYFTFPASPKDTVHIKDSLYREYAHQITIEP